MNLSLRVKAAIGLLVVLVLVAVLTPTFAHMRLHSPAPRTSPDPDVQALLGAGGLRTDPPCGDPTDIPVGPVTASYDAGSEVDIVVDNVIQHSGQRFQIFVSYDDASFLEVDPPSAPASPGSIPYVAGGVPAQGAGQHTITVGLPSAGASRATLRAFDNFAYFSCADIQLLGGGIFSDGFESGDVSAWG